MPLAGLGPDGKGTSSAADPPFCQQQEMWERTPKSNQYGAKSGGRGGGMVLAEVGAQGCGSSGASTMGRLWHDLLGDAV